MRAGSGDEIVTKETNVAHAHNSISNALNFIRNAGREEMAAVVLTALISLNVYLVFWGKGRRKNVYTVYDEYHHLIFLSFR